MSRPHAHRLGRATPCKRAPVSRVARRQGGRRHRPARPGQSARSVGQLKHIAPVGVSVWCVAKVFCAASFAQGQSRRHPGLQARAGYPYRARD